MAELIFEEVLFISVGYITMFSILQNQVNVCDTVNKSSVSFFIIY